MAGPSFLLFLSSEQTAFHVEPPAYRVQCHEPFLSPHKILEDPQKPVKQTRTLYPRSELSGTQDVSFRGRTFKAYSGDKNNSFYVKQSITNRNQLGQKFQTMSCKSLMEFYSQETNLATRYHPPRTKIIIQILGLGKKKY